MPALATQAYSAPCTLAGLAFAERFLPHRLDQIECRGAQAAAGVEFRIVPPENLPDWCPVGYDLEIHDPDGGSMMSGHMMPHGFFRRSLQLTIHYEPDAVAALGIDPGNLVLVTSADGYEIVVDAVHDADSNVFRLSTSRPAGWYGVADRTNVPVAVKQIPWGSVKANYH
jgi:hypothetical protein